MQKSEWSQNETGFKGFHKFRHEALKGRDFSPEQLCKIPLDTPSPFQNYINELTWPKARHVKSNTSIFRILQKKSESSTHLPTSIHFSFWISGWVHSGFRDSDRRGILETNVVLQEPQLSYTCGKVLMDFET